MFIFRASDFFFWAFHETVPGSYRFLESACGAGLLSRTARALPNIILLPPARLLVEVRRESGKTLFWPHVGGAKFYDGFSRYIEFIAKVYLAARNKRVITQESFYCNLWAPGIIWHQDSYLRTRLAASSAAHEATPEGVPGLWPTIIYSTRTCGYLIITWQAK